MFAGSERYTTMIGAHSERQGTGGEVTAEIVSPVASGRAGRQPFATWDETVTFTKQNTTDRTVLMERVDGTGRTPLDVGAHAGQGPRLLHRVRPRPAHVEQRGFKTLVERAIVWACRRAGARQASSS